jgi:hypothetical protein
MVVLLLAGASAPGGADSEAGPGTIAVPAVTRWPDRRSMVRLSHPREAIAVDRALMGARRRLDAPGCRELFSDFTDADGRTLQANLDRSRRTAQQHLDEIFFYDAQESRCESSGVLALAIPGSRVVRICPGFARVHERRPDYAEAVILHEALHTLGLGENPPSSQEITRAVLRHCVR